MKKRKNEKEKYNFVDLKDCPFCGQKAIRVQHPGLWGRFKPQPKKFTNDGALFGLWYVGCPSSFFDGCVKHCSINPSASWNKRLEDAERDWNERSNK